MVTKKKRATTPKTAKKKTSTTAKKEQKIDAVQKQEATQKVIVNRVLKYKYPEGCTGTLERKAFRQSVRNKLNRLEKALLKAEGRKKTIASKKFKEFQAEVLA